MKSIILTSLFCLIGIGTTFAQANKTDSLKTIDYSEAESYEIGGLKVIGAEHTDESVLLNISGLKVGEAIDIPGEEITTALNNLYALHLFENVKIVLRKTIGKIAFLDIYVEEKPRYLRHNYVGIKKSKHDDLNDIVNRFLNKGEIVTHNTILNIKRKIQDYFKEDGYLDAEVKIITQPNERIENGLNLTINIDRGKRVKIENITFSGNSVFSARKLRNAMENTRTKRRIFAKSAFQRDGYEKDLEAIIERYHKEGYRDARIKSDTVWRNEEGDIRIHIVMNEGKQYYYRNISWTGNSIYSDQTLSKILGIKKGDVYNTALLNERLVFSMTGRDVSALYMDNGHLFFSATPVEVAIVNDSVDVEIRIFEGPQATIDRVIITGNTRTHDNVIRREVRTMPGQKFSRAALLRSQRQLVGLGYFNPPIKISTPVNPSRYTVDIKYEVEERSSDQLELSAGWNQFSGIIGTLGVVFNNFSVRGLFNPEAWKPLPTGDGQRLSIRGQTNGEYYQSYNFTFTEPWLGGSKPTSFNIGGYYTKIRNITYGGYIGNGYLSISNGFVGLGTRVNWPDDNFILSGTINYENIFLQDYPRDFFANGEPISNGSFNNLTLGIKLARTSINQPRFPTRGSTISLSVNLSPPYSMFTDRDYTGLSPQEKFRFLEYHKWRFDFDWYATVVGKLVFRANAKIGFLGYYNEEIGIIPFERFEVGGSGLNNQSIGLIGRDIISMRGYEVDEFPANENGGGTVFDKFTVELRYPISLKPTATIYGLAFIQGGNVWQGLRNFNPFDMKKSVGVGLRAYLPMFGLIGFDYGFGFDKPQLIQNGAKWTSYGQFNLILGFEPD